MIGRYGVHWGRRKREVRPAPGEATSRTAVKCLERADLAMLRPRLLALRTRGG
jgi:hypothetical protein